MMQTTKIQKNNFGKLGSAAIGVCRDVLINILASELLPKVDKFNR